MPLLSRFEFLPCERGIEANMTETTFEEDQDLFLNPSRAEELARMRTLELEEGKEEKPAKSKNRTHWRGVITRDLEWRKSLQRTFSPDTLIRLPHEAYSESCLTHWEMTIGCDCCYRGTMVTGDVHLPSHPEGGDPFPLHQLDFRVNYRYSPLKDASQEEGCDCSYYEGKDKTFAKWRVVPKTHPRWREIKLQLLRLQMPGFIVRENAKGQEQHWGISGPWHYFHAETDPSELEDEDAVLCQVCHFWLTKLHPKLAENFELRGFYELMWIEWLEEHEDQLQV